MDDVTIWHNPSCSKSCAALDLLRARGVEPRIVEYLTDPPTRDELRGVIALLGIAPRELLRTSEKEYRLFGLGDRRVGDEALLDAMVRNPVLIERPVVLRGERAVLGRPPEKVLEVLT